MFYVMLVSTFTIFPLLFAINVQSCSWWIEIVPSIEQFTGQVVCEHSADFQRRFCIFKAKIHNTVDFAMFYVMLVSTFTIFPLLFAINVQSCSWWIEIVPSIEQFTGQVVCEHLADFQRRFCIFKANIHKACSFCHVLCNARFYLHDFSSTFCYKRLNLLVMDWNCSIDRTVYRASGMWTFSGFSTSFLNIES